MRCFFSVGFRKYAIGCVGTMFGVVKLLLLQLFCLVGGDNVDCG